MIILKPEAELITYTQDLLKIIEMAGRVCYKSEGCTTETSAPAFVEKVCNSFAHETVMEHGNITFRFVTDRGVSHEFVRHRIASYSQESTRYCNYGKDKFDNQIRVIRPPGLSEEQNITLGDIKVSQFDLWKKSIQAAEDSYLALIADNVPPQISRSVLPTCLKTEFFVSANPREWRHIFKMRSSYNTKAHPQIQEIVDIALATMAEKVPVLYAKIWEKALEERQKKEKK